MNAVIAFFDITLSIMCVLGIIATIVLNYYIMDDDDTVYTVMEFILAGLRITMGSWNYITLINWVGSLAVYAFLATYGHFVYIVTSAAIVVVFCIFYMLMDLVRPVEI